MNTRAFTRSLLPLAVLILPIASAVAANHTTTAQQVAGANWDDPAIWSPAVAPTLGETYEAIAGGGPTRVRNPTANPTATFGGESLMIDTGAEIRFKQNAANTDMTVT